MIKMDDLKAQLAATEAEMEAAKAHLYRCDGALQVLKHLIAESEKPEDESHASNS